MRLLFLLILTVAPALAASLTGQWSIDGNMNGNAISFDCAFQQQGTTLTGSCRAEEFAAPVTGSVMDGAVRFSFVYNFAGVPYTCTYTGKLMGDSEFQGHLIVSGIDGSKGDFVARKSAPVPPAESPR